jgi:DUF1680 family protein
MLSGVSLSADRFFYPNPLESKGQHNRQAWFGCACCPSNIARFVPAIPGYIYAVTDKDLYVNLFISNDAHVMIGGRKIDISQKANFPWDGKVEITIDPEVSSKFTLKVRIPDWALNEAIPGGLYRFILKDNELVKLTVNGGKADIDLKDGYDLISRKWKKGDKVEIEFPMPVRTVIADARVTEDTGKIAIQRGPVIYCAEWPDNKNGNVLDLVLDREAQFSEAYIGDLLGGTEVIKTQGHQVRRTTDGKIELLPTESVTLIPYALWNNRGPGQMRVWMPVSHLNN